jgi:hypothetical protein
MRAAACGRRPAHQREHLLLERGTGGGVRLARRHGADIGQVVPAPVHGPQVGRMDALGARGFLHLAVLREHRQRRDVLARQHAGDVVEQRERGVLEVVDDRARELVRLGDETLHRGLAGAQHFFFFLIPTNHPLPPPSHIPISSYPSSPLSSPTIPPSPPFPISPIPPSSFLNISFTLSHIS